jgi:hypothetical protein
LTAEPDRQRHPKQPVDHKQQVDPGGVDDLWHDAGNTQATLWLVPVQPDEGAPLAELPPQFAKALRVRTDRLWDQPDDLGGPLGVALEVEQPSDARALADHPKATACLEASTATGPNVSPARPGRIDSMPVGSPHPGLTMDGAAAPLAIHEPLAGLAFRRGVPASKRPGCPTKPPHRDMEGERERGKAQGDHDRPGDPDPVLEPQGDQLKRLDGQTEKVRQVL